MNLQENIRNDLKLFEYEDMGDRKGYITDNSNVRDPDVRIVGFGDMSYSQLKANVQKKLEDLVARGARGDYSTVDWAVNTKGGILGFLLEAIIEIEAEMEEGK
jgi:hypothetical protein